MQNIAYISHHPLDPGSGVGKKILGQISQWKRMGYRVKAFSFTKSIIDSCQENSDVVHYPEANFFQKRFAHTSELMNDISYFKPDIVYYRHDLFSINYNNIAKIFPTVVEVQTDDLSETLNLAIRNRSLKYFFAYLFSLCTRGLIFAKAQGIVAVTEELSRSRRLTQYGIPTIAIPNGILLSEYPIIKKGGGGRIQLFFMGSPGYTWHGTDIMEELAKTLPDFDFHIVGIEGADSVNVFYYGYMVADQYRKIMQKCHVCIGTLALFRIKMHEASPLKVREYLASGFPVILGYEDTSFKDRDCDFLLRVDFFGESVIANARKIRDFCGLNKERIVAHTEVSQIDSFFLESCRLEFLQSLLEQGAK